MSAVAEDAAGAAAKGASKACEPSPRLTKMPRQCSSLICPCAGGCLWTLVKRVCGVFANCVKGLSVRTVSILLRVGERFNCRGCMCCPTVMLLLLLGDQHNKFGASRRMLILCFPCRKWKCDPFLLVHLYRPLCTGSFELRCR